MSLAQNIFARRATPMAGMRPRHARSLIAVRNHLAPVGLSLLVIAGVTVCLLGARYFFGVNHISDVYMIPVLWSAARWGIVPGVTSALAGVTITAFFFAEPIYSFSISDPEDVLDLILFLAVALVTSHLTANVRRREEELRTLYSFSRRLAVAPDPSSIYAAIQDHLNFVLGRRVVLFATIAEVSGLDAPGDGRLVPDRVREAVADAMKPGGVGSEVTIFDEPSGANWLIRAVSQKNPFFGMVVIELGRVSERALRVIRQRIDSVLSEAAATLERLDVAGALGEAKTRIEAETFRDALLGSVSHELRTPLASLVGSAYVLANAPSLKQDSAFAALADDVHHEAERLNDDIQNLLDASRITGAGIRPHLQWADAADIVHAAVERRKRRLSSHRLELDIPEELPLVQTDPTLIEQALGQILDNAVKYSPTGSLIRVAGTGRDGEVSIAVADQGGGLSDEERVRIWERFYRSPRHHATTGSGLGLWIARAFVLGTGGRIEATDAPTGNGTMVIIHLPAPPPTSDEVRSDDE
jgi:two-component system sensor histidine kinase KdpD